MFSAFTFFLMLLLLPVSTYCTDIYDEFYQGCAIAVVAYNRPHYLTSVLTFLRENPESQHLPIYFFLDGGKQSTQLANQNIIESFGFPETHIVKRAENLGCEKNILSALHEIFDVLQYQRIIMIEDDQVISPHYLQFLKNLYHWCKKNIPNTGMITGNAICHLSPEEKYDRLECLTTESVHLWAYCMERPVWDRLQDTIQEYEEIFLTREDCDSVECNQAIQSWIRNRARIHGEHDDPLQQPVYFFENPQMATGQDALIYLAMWEQGLLQISPVVNRMLNIGKKGCHFTPQQFDEIIGDMELIIFEEDEITEFVL